MIIKDGNVRVYPSGRVRLTGKALERLRQECFERDNWTCTCGCGRGAPLVLDMAHIKSRGAGGSDCLSNVKTMTHECHMRAHNGNA